MVGVFPIPTESFPLRSREDGFPLLRRCLGQFFGEGRVRKGIEMNIGHHEEGALPRAFRPREGKGGSVRRASHGEQHTAQEENSNPSVKGQFKLSVLSHVGW